jgi:hypothetical protein
MADALVPLKSGRLLTAAGRNCKPAASCRHQLRLRQEKGVYRNLPKVTVSCG